MIYDSNLIKKRTKEIVDELNQSNVRGINGFVRKLSNTGNNEDRLDILVEGRLAALLAKNGFSEIEMEPSPEIDVKADFAGHSIYFQVRRRRPMDKDWELAESGGPIWASPVSTDSVNDMISEKLRQLKDGEINVLLIWSNTIKLGRPEIEEVFKYIREEVKDNAETYRNLSAIMLVQDERIDLAMPNKVHLFMNCRASRQLPDSINTTLQCIVGNAS